jgi:DNA-binding transcriptional ArsR family regulator
MGHDVLTAFATIQAMSNPIRFAILDLVSEREMGAGEIALRFKSTRPAVSQHLRILRHAGLVKTRRLGTRRLYSLRRQGFEPLRTYLDGYWSLRLRRLKLAAEEAERRKRIR